MRTLIVSPDVVGPTRCSGIGSAFTALAQTLTEAGHQVEVLITGGTYSENGSFEQWRRHYDRRGITITPLPKAPTKTYRSAYTDLSWRVYNWITEQKDPFDVIHFPDWHGVGFYTMLAKRHGLGFCGTPYILHGHGPLRWTQEGNGELPNWHDLEAYFLEEQCARMADVFVSPSQYLRDWYKSNGYTLPADTRIIPYCVGTDSKWRLPRGVPELVFFGRLEPRKGLLRFCDALDILAREPNPPKFDLTFLGRVTEIGEAPANEFLFYRAKKKSWPWDVAIIADKGQKESIEYLTERGYYAVMPSLVDNSPCAIYECLDAGIPFIASDVGGIPELIYEPDRSRVLCKPEPEALAAKIREALSGDWEQAIPNRLENRKSRWVEFHEKLCIKPALPLQLYGEEPLVSIIMPVFNRLGLLKQALASIENQNYTNFEVILIDDASTDPAMQKYLKGIEGSAGLTIIRNETNLGPSECRNLAVKQAKGKYLFFADSDNIYLPICLEMLVSIAERGACDVVVPCLNRFEGMGEPPAKPKVQVPYLGSCAAAGIFTNGLGDTCSLWRSGGFTELGGFAEDHYLLAEDWELFTRAIIKGFKITVCPEITVWLRYNEDSRYKQHHPRYNLRGRLKPLLDGLSKPLQDALLCGVASSNEIDDVRRQNYKLRKQIAAGRANWARVYEGLIQLTGEKDDD